MLLLASLVIVPLGLGLAVSTDLRDRSRRLRMAVWLQFPAGLMPSLFRVSLSRLGRSKDAVS